MNTDRSHWTVRKVTFAEAEELDDQYYSSLSALERLEILMDLRSMWDCEVETIAPVVIRRHIHQFNEI